VDTSNLGKLNKAIHESPWKARAPPLNI
jgi:hypothetical protein